MDSAIKDVLEGIVKAYENELDDVKTSADLEQFWFFKYDPKQSPEINLYEFHKALECYGRRCREWETKNNGYVCVVERVRDQYLLPKIREFLKNIP